MPDPGQAVFYVCSGCFSEHPRSHIHVLPTWNEYLQDFVTTFRCDKCWTDSLAWTQLKAVVLTEDTREKFCLFLDGHDCAEEAAIIRHASLEDAGRQVGIILDCIASGSLYLRT
jgi:hypothetical protein